MAEGTLALAAPDGSAAEATFLDGSRVEGTGLLRLSEVEPPGRHRFAG